MSWSANLVIPPDTAPDEVAGLIASATISGQDIPEAHSAFKVAAKVAADIIASGEVGALGSVGFNVYLNGHANPNHEPQAGWSNDTIGVSIYQTPSPNSTPDSTGAA